MTEDRIRKLARLVWGARHSDKATEADIRELIRVHTRQSARPASNPRPILVRSQDYLAAEGPLWERPV